MHLRWPAASGLQTVWSCTSSAAFLRSSGKDAMTPDDNWHPVGMSNAIEAGNSAGTHLFGQELVVWRDSSGVAHVNEDRCPHRGMKLNFGFVRGDRIACLYHGWQFDRDGVCRYIPAHPALDVPVTIR